MRYEPPPFAQRSISVSALDDGAGRWPPRSSCSSGKGPWATWCETP